MMDLVKNQEADVLCFQEFYDLKQEHSSFSVVRHFKESGYPYTYFVRSTLEKRLNKIGVAIFSRYPIIDTACFSFGENDFAEHLIYADIQFNDQKVRIFTTHLQSVRFEDEQYTALRKIKRTDESGLKGFGTIVRKLKTAYEFRSVQADFVNAKIRESPYPVIVCGDFNDVPNSYTYFKIKGDLQDAFLKKGSSLGRTFRYLSPTLRIDYIIADKKLEVTQFNRLIAPFSDHYPVVADFMVPGNLP